MTMIDAIKERVEQACRADTNVFGYGIWSHHIVHVVDHGKALAAMLGADAEIVELAALLHDYAGIKDVLLEPEHHLHSAREAEQMLKEFGYPEERIEAVKHCIVTHRASKYRKPETPEAVCLASADAIAHIDQAVSLLYLTYAEKKMDIDSGAAWVRGKLVRSWNKLCPQAQFMIGKKYQAALLLLSR